MIFTRGGLRFNVLVRSGPRTFTTHDPIGLCQRLAERGYAPHNGLAPPGAWYQPAAGTVIVLSKARSAPILITRGGLVVVVPTGRGAHAAARNLQLARLTIDDTAQADVRAFS